MSKKGRVLVAMSGGIDSTVAAVMLHEEGYEVIGVTMKTWDYANSGGSKK
jgi:tRNA-specific 2-thiouridylase